MRLFTYQNESGASQALLAGSFGVDLPLAARHFAGRYPGMNIDLAGMPVSLVGWLSDVFWRETAGTAAGWALEEHARGEDWTRRENVIFYPDSVRFLAPVPAPGKVICIAGNYPAPGSLDKPAHPTIFLKPTGGVAAHRQPVVIPAVAKNVAYEVELAVIIGRRGRNLQPDEALSIAAGYTLANDLGDRELEKRTSQWTSGKMFDTFTPMGPFVVTPDEILALDRMEMTTRVNGERVQHGWTGEMFFSVPEILAILSELTTLQPGDVVLCGSPKMMNGHANPVVAVQPGDQVEVSIESLGSLCNPTVAEEEAA